MSWFTKLDTDSLVAVLQRANWSYHNTSESLMTDDDYDRGLTELKQRAPSHPFLSLVGAPGSKCVVILPVSMGSQDKVREGEKGMERWLKRESQAGVKQYVVSEKLDGLSALYTVHDNKNCLYLRGDGVKGVVVGLHKHIIGMSSLSSLSSVSSCIVRGEILLRNADVPVGSIGRSLVNGWAHRTDAVAAAELSKVRFVAYEVLQPAMMKRSAQLQWLREHGFEVPWAQVWPCAALKDGLLKKALIQRKSQGDYPLDGLVIATDSVPVCLGGGEARNPPDSVAYKASLDEQKAETTVVYVEWNLSRQGFWIPRIQIEPVQIGGAKINWLSGHNAKIMEEHGIGKGARIVIRRSGDVIPTLDSVVSRALIVDMPLGQGQTWEWDANHVHAKALTKVLPNGQGILHAFQTLGVEGIGPGLVKKMVAGGFTTILKVRDASQEDLAACIGGGRAVTFANSLRVCVSKATMSTFLVASNMLPRGVAEKKLRVVFDKEADPKKWTAEMYPLEGWSEESFQELLDVLPELLEWIAVSFPRPVALAKTEDKDKPVTKWVVFTGVRDKVLEGLLAGIGWAMEDSVTKKTTALVVAEEAKETGKMKKARDMGIKILKLSEFRQMFQMLQKTLP